MLLNFKLHRTADRREKFRQNFQNTFTNYFIDPAANLLLFLITIIFINYYKTNIKSDDENSNQILKEINYFQTFMLVI